MSRELLHMKRKGHNKSLEKPSDTSGGNPSSVPAGIPVSSELENRRHDATARGQAGCVIVGGGPAGAMLALLLARRGVRVTLIEMHHDFDREFRGDTVHPSTLEILDQIGLAERVHGPEPVLLAWKNTGGL